MQAEVAIVAPDDQVEHLVKVRQYLVLALRPDDVEPVWQAWFHLYINTPRVGLNIPLPVDA